MPTQVITLRFFLMLLSLLGHAFRNSVKNFFLIFDPIKESIS